MSLIENIVSAVKPHNSKGTIHVVDRSPLNWLYIITNTTPNAPDSCLPKPVGKKIDV
ncbi:MAG: hypothetical protein H0T08_05455 [Acidobacteria bacterium]|jgi:hypothetical protein|nr:hypothetical protein [Acidobacteriota bacterium]